MSLMKERPLALFLLMGAGAFSLSCAANSVELSLIFLGISLLFVLLSALKQKSFVPLLLCVALILGVTLGSFLFRPLWDLGARFPDEVTVTGQLTEITYNENGICYATLRTRTVEESGKTSRIRRNVRFSAALSEDETLKEGDVIRFKTVFASLTQDESYLVCDGFGGSAEAEERTLCVIENDALPLSARFAETRLSLLAKLQDRTDEATGGLIAALLFGERHGLEASLSADFKTAGVSHLLALSGLHLSVLAFALSKLLLLLRIPRRLRDLLLILLTAAFVLFTGASPSVLRAGGMLILATLLKLIGKTSDSVTNLSIALTVILAFFPNAACDLSLWLSALATLAILALSEEKRLKKRQNVPFYLKKAVYPFTVSLAATLFTLPLCALLFGEFSLAGILSTVLLTIPVELFILAGLPILLLGGILPLGAPFSALYGLLSKFLRLVGRIPYVKLSTVRTVCTVFAVILALALLYWLLGSENRKRRGLLVVLSALLLVVSAAVTTYLAQTNERLTYFSDRNAEILLQVEAGESTLYDFSADGYAAAGSVAELAKSAGIVKVDRIVLTRNALSSAKNIKYLLASLSPKKVYLPRVGESTGYFDAVKSVCESFGTSVHLYGEGDVLCFAETELTVKSLYANGSSVLLHLDTAALDLACLGAGCVKDEYNSEIQALLRDSSAALFGKCGHRYQNEGYLPALPENIKDLVISNEVLLYDIAEITAYQNRGEITLSPRRYEFIR